MPNIKLNARQIVRAKFPFAIVPVNTISLLVSTNLRHTSPNRVVATGNLPRHLLVMHHHLRAGVLIVRTHIHPGDVLQVLSIDTTAHHSLLLVAHLIRLQDAIIRVAEVSIVHPITFVPAIQAEVLTPKHVAHFFIWIIKH